MGLRVHGDGVAMFAGVVMPDQKHSRPLDIEYGQVSALRRHVEPTEPGIDAQHIGTGARRCPADAVSAVQVDTEEQVIVLASDEGALAIGMDPEAVGTAATGQ